MRDKYVGAVVAKGELGAVAVRRDGGRDKLRLDNPEAEASVQEGVNK